MNESKKFTPLHGAHLNHGARMVEFSGWEMPVQYEGIIKEHEFVRNNAGLFDISHMGEFLLEGPDVIPLLQKLMTNDLKLLEPSKSQYSCMCSANGTTIDDNIYYMESSERFRLIINAGNREKDFNWIMDNINDYNVEITDISSERGRLAFQGPKAEELLTPLVDIDLSTIKRFHFAFCNLKEMPIFIARTGYTGENGFEISFETIYSEKIWDAILNTGAKPIGLGARDSLRLEACYSLYGHEINEFITPVEAGIGWVVKAKDGIDYIGKEVLLRQKAEGTSRTLVGLNLIDRGVIRENYKIFKNGEEIGFVTSGGYSPTLKKSIGLALVKTEHRAIGTNLDVEIRGKLLKAVVVGTPFYRKV